MLRAGLRAEGELFAVTHIKLRLASSIGIDFFPWKKIPSVFNFCERVLFEEFVVSFPLFYIDPWTPEKVNVNVWGKNSSNY